MRNSTYTVVPIEDHKIWIEQCFAARTIREHFGLEKSLAYLVSEKLFTFIGVAAWHGAYAAELPAFATEVSQIFSVDEIAECLDQMERRRGNCTAIRTWLETPESAATAL